MAEDEAVVSALAPPGGPPAGHRMAEHVDAHAAVAGQVGHLRDPVLEPLPEELRDRSAALHPFEPAAQTTTSSASWAPVPKTRR